MNLLLATAIALSACGSEEAGDAAACPTPAAVDTTALPEDLPLQRWGTVVRVQERAGFVGAEILSRMEIVALYTDIVDTLTGNGYTLLGGDNEGFEAEISFLGSADELVNLVIRRGRCAGEVRVRVLLESVEGGRG
jgi:hypothetical protein